MSDNLPNERTPAETPEPEDIAERLLGRLNDCPSCDLAVVELADDLITQRDDLAERVESLTDAIENDEQHAIGWLKGVQKAMDIMPSRNQLERWMEEVAWVRQRLEDATTAEAIIHRAGDPDYQREPEPAGSGEQQ